MAIDEANYRVKCAEIWGGVGNAESDISTNGVTASIYSRSCDGESGGDIHYVSVCSHDVLSRVLIADLSGHGSSVSELSKWIYEQLRENIDNLNGNDVFDSLNRMLFAKGFESITTAIMATFCTVDSRLYICNAGHLPGILKYRESKGWRPITFEPEKEPSDLPLGVLANTIYSQNSIAVAPGDRLVLYTDGVTECTSDLGEEFGEAGLCNFLNDSEDCSVSDLRSKLLESLSSYSSSAFTHDDLTFFWLQIL